MCGIAGYIDFLKHTPASTIQDMIQTLDHRGPDGKGVECYNEEEATIGLGHSRLSIIDISTDGDQPMKYKTFTIVFNGEIYNYKEIRLELEELGHKFVSNTDTEVILHSFEQWSTDFVARLIGMFVIVIYDKSTKRVFLFRDRAGVKPIYYYWHNNLFLFASELKALIEHSAFIREIDTNVLPLFFDFGYIPAPYSIFKHTLKVEPGMFLILDLIRKELSYHRYWDINSHYRANKFTFKYEEAKERLLDLLKSSFNYRMVADVPVGIFLSGGYDSSAVTAVLQKDRTEKLKTFTIGFEEGINEVPFARDVAKYLGTDHIEYICTMSEAQQIIPDLPYFYDEPFADSSAIPTILVSKVARNIVKVALSSDAGDELFCGYTHYQKFDRVLHLLNKLPIHLNFILSPILSSLSYVTPIKKPEIKQKLKCVSKALHSNKLQQAANLYKLSCNLPQFYQTKLFSANYDKYPTKYDNDFTGFNNIPEIMMAIDYEMYLQNDILTKVDRASMSVSLEGREPFVDHRLAEFAARLPLEYKYNELGGKRILKDIVHDNIPRELVDRPKAGFSLPIYNWLTNDLSFLLDEYLSEKSIKESGFFKAKFVSQQVELFKGNKFYYKPLIWKLLMFQMWYFRWMK
ncbi:MAG: asparagine synthase (glutamine-hydrolyzing) [Prolixibacteraceae bacterium]|jgi:asparagine synthase (glutamine-hydrolysing)|nr:asparagine synthase (glutamine-hydrolyzing) [Prolixibacteraceae bacterium]HHV25550.1 asparagine synthase (glutamine-hydrolyzing) [Methanosarcina sp.]